MWSGSRVNDDTMGNLNPTTVVSFDVSLEGLSAPQARKGRTIARLHLGVSLGVV